MGKGNPLSIDFRKKKTFHPSKTKISNYVFTSLRLQNTGNYKYDKVKISIKFSLEAD